MNESQKNQRLIDVDNNQLIQFKTIFSILASLEMPPTIEIYKYVYICNTLSTFSTIFYSAVWSCLTTLADVHDCN